MADEWAKTDSNDKPTLIAVTDDSNQEIRRLLVDPTTGRLLVSGVAGSGTVTSLNTLTGAITLAAGTNITLTPVGNTITIASAGAGTGTVTSVSVVTANGISGSVATDTTTPAITLTLGAITPTTVNGNTLTTGTGTITITGTKTLTVSDTATVSGTNTGDQNIFASIPVSGQTTVTPASTSQALTLVGSGGLTITTDNTTKTITFTQAGGGGTVTATGGALTANAVVLGNGTTDTKVSTGITTNGTAQLILGVNTTTMGTVKMFGSTSGDVTITPTAIAGTATIVTVPARSLTLDNITTATTTNGTGFLKGNGTVISFDNSTYLTSVGTGVTNEITYWSGTNTLGSLATATYPSLTELSYVKGVTSGIQAQINAKAATLSGTINEIAYFNTTSTVASLAVATYPSLTELSYVKGVTSAIQTQIGLKAPLASPSFTGIVTLSGNTQVNLTLPTANTYVTGNMTNSFQSGCTASAYDLVFLGNASKWLEVGANAVATCQGLIGIALEAKNNTQAMKVALPGCFVRYDTWNWTVGATLYASGTLGGISETIPTGANSIIKVIGFAVNADCIFFNPSPDQQSTVA
jgi:hypothetical protein